LAGHPCAGTAVGLAGQARLRNGPVARRTGRPGPAAGRLADLRPERGEPPAGPRPGPLAPDGPAVPSRHPCRLPSRFLCPPPLPRRLQLRPAPIPPERWGLPVRRPPRWVAVRRRPPRPVPLWSVPPRPVPLWSVPPRPVPLVRVPLTPARACGHLPGCVPRPDGVHPQHPPAPHPPTGQPPPGSPPSSPVLASGFAPRTLP
jgi:hypothetical protein